MTKKTFCINCDNKHGCKTENPPCIVEMTEQRVTGKSGKRYLVERNGIDRCEACPFFRSCWNMDEYRRLTAAG